MSGWEREQMLEAARSVRVYLDELVDDPASFDAQITDLLERASRQEDVEFELAELLLSSPLTKTWTTAFLAKLTPPTIERRGGASFIQISGPVKVDRFECPQGDFSWYRFAPGQRPPKCPTHATDLVRT